MGPIHTLSDSPGQLTYSCHMMQQFLIPQMAIDEERPGLHICDRWKYKLWKSENIQKVGLKGECFKSYTPNDRGTARMPYCECI